MNSIKFTDRFLVHGVGLNDSLDTSGFKDCPAYRTWHSMLGRCYSAKIQKANPAYIGCTVCEDWLRFSTFKAWMLEQDYEGKEIDKDILVQGNKVYSPTTCIFVPKRVNQLFKNQTAKVGKHKLGVTWVSSNNKFRAQCCDGSKQVFLGNFELEDDAHLAYLQFKKGILIKVAMEQSDMRLREAILRRAYSYRLA